MFSSGSRTAAFHAAPGSASAFFDRHIGGAFNEIIGATLRDGGECTAGARADHHRLRAFEPLAGGENQAFGPNTFSWPARA